MNNTSKPATKRLRAFIDPRNGERYFALEPRVIPEAEPATKGSKRAKPAKETLPEQTLPEQTPAEPPEPPQGDDAPAQ